MAKMNVIHTLPLLVVKIIHVFLHRDLKKEVCMSIPSDLTLPRRWKRLWWSRWKDAQNEEHMAWIKAIPKAWFERFSQVMQNIGCIWSHKDHTSFFKELITRWDTYLIVYVDDPVIAPDGTDKI